LKRSFSLDLILKVYNMKTKSKSVNRFLPVLSSIQHLKKLIGRFGWVSNSA